MKVILNKNFETELPKEAISQANDLFIFSDFDIAIQYTEEESALAWSIAEFLATGCQQAGSDDPGNLYIGCYDLYNRVKFAKK